MSQAEFDPQSPRAFRLCDRCGSPTPSHLPQCVNCGAVSLQAVVDEQAAQAVHVERRFLTALSSRAVYVTYAILAGNVLIYLLMVWVAGGNYVNNFLYMNDVGTLVGFGAKTNELLRQGEWFRLVTPIFIHGGLLHLASNSYAIWMVGPLVEKLYGSARFSLIYLLAGVGGVIGSYLGGFSRPAYIPGVGASGAIFGLFGLLLVFGYRYRDELPPNFRRSIKSGILPVIVINLFIGFSIPAIDNAAHIGGLLAGVGLVCLIPYLAPGRAGVSAVGLLALALCLAVVAGSFLWAYQQRMPHLHRRASQIEQFLHAIDAADEAMTSVFEHQAGREAKLSPAQLAGNLQAARTSLEQTGAPDRTAEEVRRHLLSLLGELQSSVERPDPFPPPAGTWRKMVEELLQSRQEVKDWIKTEGARYGLRLREPAPSENESQKE